MSFRMNELELLAAHGGTEYRRNLLALSEPIPREGIANVCLCPPEAASMYIVLPGTDRISNFRLGEFANRSGLVKVHPVLVLGLQSLRDALGVRLGHKVGIFITSGFRSAVDQKRLAIIDRLGWDDEGGKVARNSMHMHGVAADIHAWDWSRGARVDKSLLLELAAPFFDFTKTYHDTGHVHVDQRYKSGIL